MLRVKTIVHKISEPDRFDAEVNKAISEGWVLKYRTITEPFEGPKYLARTMLVAYLEREIALETKPTYNLSSGEITLETKPTYNLSSGNKG